MHSNNKYSCDQRQKGARTLNGRNTEACRENETGGHDFWKRLAELRVLEISNLLVSQMNAQRSQRRSDYQEDSSSDGDDRSSSNGNPENRNSSRSISPPSIRQRPLRVSATQAREYIDDEEELPFDAIHAEQLTRWKEDDICLQFAVIF